MNINIKKVVVAMRILELYKTLLVLRKLLSANVVIIMTTTQTLVTYIMAVTSLASLRIFTLTFLVWNARTIPMICRMNKNAKTTA